MKVKNWQIWGLQTKTFSVEIAQSDEAESYPLSVNRHIGLPKNAVIYTIQCRLGDGKLTKDDEGKIISSGAIFGGQLTLLDGNGQTILKSIPLLSLVNNAPPVIQNLQYSLTWFKPIRACEIDWQSSNVSISRGAKDIDDKTVVEFTVYYSCFPQVDFEKHFQEYQSNIKNLGLRSAMLYVSPEFNAEEKISLSKNSSIGIPSDAVLIGMNFLNNADLVQPNGKTMPNSTITKGSFLTLKCGNEIILDALPYEHWIPQQLGLNYFPVPPMCSEEIDWEGSYIENVSGSNISQNNSYQIILFFICNNPNSL